MQKLTQLLPHGSILQPKLCNQEGSRHLFRAKRPGLCKGSMIHN